MRAPVNSEGDAFRAVLAVVAIVGVSLALGYITGAELGPSLVGVALLLAVVLAAIWWALPRAPEDSSVREAAAEGDRYSGPRRILLIAGRPPTPGQLEAMRRVDPKAVLDVHAPVLQSRTHFVTTDIDRETELARRRLRTTLHLAHEAGIQAGGEVGDPIDPLAGIEDRLRRQHVDEVIVATSPLAQANWVETDLLEQLREHLDRPLTHVEIG
jgi:hypothetical protein